jgi:hypothetical protein
MLDTYCLGYQGRKEVLAKNWPDTNEKLECRKLINCTNTIKIKIYGKIFKLIVNFKIK